MTTTRTPKLVIGRDRSVTLDGRRIGTVYPDPADQRSNHRWCFQHISGLTLANLHPGLAWNRTAQIAWTKQDAADELVKLHYAIQDTYPHQLESQCGPIIPRSTRRRRSQTAAARELAELSRDFAAAWDERDMIDGFRQHVARDAVSDVQAGIQPRKALLLNGFALTTTRGRVNHACH